MPENPNPKLHIAVCDDELIDRQQAEKLTSEIMAAEGLACSVSTYENATALLDAIQGGAQFHILLLDVMMEGLDGMEFAAALRKLGDSTAIIFISSNREMALRGYEVSAARYLAKPLREDQLREALLYCYKTFCEKKEILLPTEKGQSKMAPLRYYLCGTLGAGSKALAHQRANRNLRKIFQPDNYPAGTELYPLSQDDFSQPCLYQASALQ